MVRRFSLLLLWLLTAAMIVSGGRQPAYSYGPQETEWSYPFLGVLVVLGISVVELGVAWLILRPTSYSRSWARAALALAVFGVWGFFSAAIVMHAPGYITAHALWVLSLALIAAFLLILSGTTTIVAILRSRARRRAV